MPDPSTSLDSLHPPVPPISSRAEPRFASAARKGALADAFQEQGEDYDRLRPRYPDAVIDAVLEQVPSGPDGGAVRAIDLGAGTGKLSWALVGRGLDVTAVDTSAAMLETALRRVPSAPDGEHPASAGGATVGEALAGGALATGTPTHGAPAHTASTPMAPAHTASASAAPTLTTHLAPAESTGLPAGSAELITVAQAWHWFDAPAASAEVTRLLAPGGVLALVWNMLDVTIPWVHRLSRIMHAGDIHREDFLPTVEAGLELTDRAVHRWEDPMRTQDVIDLARTRSYVITASEERRAKVLANLDWYLHEHLGHARGSLVGVPYRTNWFLYRVATGGAFAPNLAS
ncbi:ubiquinone biosynthesis protein [Brachybacterium sp. P6-10-X1]|uniref:class I SAM-dependent methyltransferase n=1 Tax=Brachybacterium sp. P6-10-X1 TaxID=1903186 RepID=UPI000971BAFE|nr:methyltransferase domain-containing protein [Brachybacterium sp. P6-10-X1]APX33010.1 ubiquinone biosynthesis protein [Brachybacterium sp. P6-10-X1]